MTPNSARIDRMEVLLSSTIEGPFRPEKIVAENAASLREPRAIEAWSSRIANGITITEAEEVSSAMSANINRPMSTLMRRWSRSWAPTADQAATTVFCCTLGGRYQPKNTHEAQFLAFALPSSATCNMIRP